MTARKGETENSCVHQEERWVNGFSYPCLDRVKEQPMKPSKNKRDQVFFVGLKKVLSVYRKRPGFDREVRPES